jgi:N-acyl-L-homoserine lactone synthetase
VYCVERGFLPGEAGEESDEFDVHSRHILIRQASDGQVVGTARVIAYNWTRPSDSYPMQKFCDPSLFRDLPLQTTGEISRFGLSKTKRIGLSNVSQLRLALVRGLVHLSSEMGITHWLAVMERTLVRLNERNAIHFDPMGPAVSYHGIRQPMVAELTGMLERVRREQTPTWDFLTAGGKWFCEKQLVLQAA